METKTDWSWRVIHEFTESANGTKLIIDLFTDSARVTIEHDEHAMEMEIDIPRPDFYAAMMHMCDHWASLGNPCREVDEN